MMIEQKSLSSMFTPTFVNSSFLVHSFSSQVYMLPFSRHFDAMNLVHSSVCANAPFMVNSWRISTHIATVVPNRDVWMTVKSGICWVSKSSASDSSLSHWSTVSGAGEVCVVRPAAAVVVPRVVVVTVVEGAAAATGWVMKLSKCLYTCLPFDFTAWVNCILNITQFSLDDLSFRTLLSRVLEVARVVVDMVGQQGKNTEGCRTK